ncbi:MAG: excalibur calcium-binding domain-containing protein [Zoogloeaceae bacterium]|jgi:hypothetical protein|nr:excalibur calcium-binding domain-containing protein [Zoogloeaceae bacterium]
MKKLIFLLLLAAVGWVVYERFSPHDKPYAHTSAPETKVSTWPETPRYQCDGRTHCSQMTSCEEAVWFLENCPNTKMDGDHDGIPCEQQWCNGVNDDR